MNPQTKSLLVVHHEGVGDLILSFPLLRLISDNFKDYDLYLWIGTDRRDLFLSFDRFEIVEECDEEALDRVLELYHDIVFDLGTGLSHITDTSPGASLKYGTYVGFSRPTTVPRDYNSQVTQRSNVEAVHFFAFSAWDYQRLCSISWNRDRHI